VEDRPAQQQSPNLMHSILTMKCPCCRTAKMFKVPLPTGYKHFGEMHEKCPVCGQKLELEPGFYYGAMYVSYGLNVAIFVGLWLIYSLAGASVFDSPWYFMLIVGITSFLLMPITFRLSRSVWAHMFIKYKEPAGEE